MYTLNVDNERIRRYQNVQVDDGKELKEYVKLTWFRVIDLMDISNRIHRGGQHLYLKNNLFIYNNFIAHVLLNDLNWMT